MLHGPFVDFNRADFEQPVYGMSEIGYACGLFKFGYAQTFLFRESHYDNGLGLGEFHVGISFVEVFIKGDESLAFDFQSGREGGLHHFTCRAKIIAGNPFPELQLRETDHRLRVEQSHQGLHFIVFWRMRVYVGYDAGIILPASELHKHAAAPLQQWSHLCRNAVCERACNR